MSRKTVSGIMLTLLLVSMLTLAFNVQPVEAEGTIYIRPDGSVDPHDAPISSVDNVTYIFTDDIYDEIVVERDNIVVDGVGCTVQGTGSGTGIYLRDRSNVTIKNMEIKAFDYGIHLYNSSNSSISGNNITNNGDGIWLEWLSSYTSISGNNITNNGDGVLITSYSSSNSIIGNTMTNNDYGVRLDYSSSNTISGNNITNNNYGIELWDSSSNSISRNNITSNYGDGIELYYLSRYNTVSGNNITSNYGDGIELYDVSTYNTVSGNNITSNYGSGVVLSYYSGHNSFSGNNITNNNYCGIHLDLSTYNSFSGNTITNNNYCGIELWDSSSNMIYHNNFVDNAEQVYSYGSTNVWDDGYPCGGNYWSDYTDEDLYCGPDQDKLGRDGVWDHPYVIDADIIESDNYPLVKPYVPGNLSVSIYTDKPTYHAGETMRLGLEVTNPDSVKHLCFAVWCELPDSSIYLYMHEHSVLLPIGFRYANPVFKTFTVPSLPSGTYTWHAAFLERTTHTIIAEDTAQWEFA